MTILFLHGLNSTPGGIKPTFLKDHGHTLLNPALPDDDFDAAVRIAQAEFDRGKPDVVVGSSRGGAVAMNINVGDSPLVLLCPAWKRWGSVTTVKPGTVILHSKTDEVVPFSDSVELVRDSGLPSDSLIEVGTEHRLADPESLAKMLEVVKIALPAYIVRRIRREPPLLSGSNRIVEDSTPVVAFGNPWKSIAATVGLNPGRVGFLDNYDQLLDGDRRTLATLKSLRLSRLSDAKMSHIREIIEDCTGYFQRVREQIFFNKLEPLLNKLGASYYNGTACHLDLVQWATKPNWGGLSSADRKKLLSDDVHFLKQ